MKKEILFQLDIAWQLFEYHCHNLGEEEAMWCKMPDGLQVRRRDEKWVVDWPDTEAYAIGPSSIAWTMWHIIYWWKAICQGKIRFLSQQNIRALSLPSCIFMLDSIY